MDREHVEVGHDLNISFCYNNDGKRICTIVFNKHISSVTIKWSGILSEEDMLEVINHSLLKTIAHHCPEYMVWDVRNCSGEWTEIVEWMNESFIEKINSMGIKKTALLDKEGLNYSISLQILEDTLSQVMPCRVFVSEDIANVWFGN